MAKVSPTKSSEHPSKKMHGTSVVTHSRLAEGHYATTFPHTTEGGVPNTHTSPRQGPDMNGAKKAKMTY